MRFQLLLTNLVLLLLISSCNQQLQNEQKDEVSIAQPIRLELNLSGNSRTSRFLGTFDEIDRLTLDLNRVYGNRKVVTGKELNKDNQTSKWIGSVDKLIVGFDYIITGHAYKTYDNGSSVEIFRGETLHKVDEGVNSISLRMSPLLDERNLTVPRITRMERPFQMSTGDSDNITISLDTVSEDDDAVDGKLFYRFRVVDNLTGMAIGDPVLTGSFSSSSGTLQKEGGKYPDISSRYTAPDNRSTQKIQIRVTNELEIGVTSHFSIFITDNISISSGVNNSPVILTLNGERTGFSSLRWTLTVKDDGPFSNLDVAWDYLFGETLVFADFGRSEETTHQGVMFSTLKGYQDTDSGMVLVTVCENNVPGYSGCSYGSNASTSISLELIPYAFQQPLVCDGNDCITESIFGLGRFGYTYLK